MDRLQALAIVKEYVKNQNLINHMLSVEAAMRFYAQKLAQDENLWGVTGLLHDFDWEIHPTLEEHPQAGATILRDRSVPEEIVRAILSHADHTGVPRETPMEKALFACDEITGLITAVALVRPSRSLYDLTASSVKKKWKDRRFAAGVDRDHVEEVTADFSRVCFDNTLELWPHIGNVLAAMQASADLLELDGRLAVSE